MSSGARIDELPRDRATAGKAACNPAFSVADTRRLLDELGMPA